MRVKVLFFLVGFVVGFAVVTFSCPFLPTVVLSLAQWLTDFYVHSSGVSY